jgi:hypothetical protein
MEQKLLVELNITTAQFGFEEHEDTHATRFEFAVVLRIDAGASMVLTEEPGTFAKKVSVGD